MIAAQNSIETVLQRKGKPWRKGQSGNPGGRPKIAADVKEAARRHTDEALNRLVFWMRSDDPQASIRAAPALLDRGCGKPAQEVNQKGGLKLGEDVVFRWITPAEALAKGLDPASVGALQNKLQ